jgi:hypothetical protein
MPSTTAGFGQFDEGVAKAAGLNGAAGSIGLGVKEEYHWFSGKVRQADGLLVLILECEIGNFFVEFHNVLDVWKNWRMGWGNACP